MKYREPAVGIEPTTAKIRRKRNRPLTLIVVNRDVVADFSAEAAPKRPPYVQLRATVADLYAKIKRAFQEWEHRVRYADMRRRLERYEGRDLTPAEASKLLTGIRAGGWR